MKYNIMTVLCAFWSVVMPLAATAQNNPLQNGTPQNNATQYSGDIFGREPDVADREPDSGDAVNREPDSGDAVDREPDSGDAANREPDAATQNNATQDGGDTTGGDTTGGEQAAADRSQTESQYRQWQQTLKYGIESEVSDILSILHRERISELSAEVEALFLANFSDSLLIAALRYFERIETYLINHHVTDILTEHRQHSEGLVLQGLYYLRNAPPSLSADTLATIRSLTAAEMPAVARAAVDALAAHGNSSDVALITDLLTDYDTADDVRGGAIIAIGELGMTGNLSDLYRVLEDEQERSYLRQYAATSIGKLAQPDSADILIRFSSHGDARLRATVIEALSAYQTERVTAILNSALRDANDLVRLAAIRAFYTRKITPDALDTIQYKAIRDPNPEIQRESIAILVREQSGAGARYIREQITGDAPLPFSVHAEMIVGLVEHNYQSSRADIATLFEDELDSGRKSFLLYAAAQRLSGAEAPYADDLYATLLRSVDRETVLYAIQGISFNNITRLRGELAICLTITAILPCAAKRYC